MKYMGSREAQGMDNKTLKEIILENKENFLDRKDIIPRNIKVSLDDVLKIKHIVVVTGVRRCGKSCLLSIWADELIKKHRVNPDNILYINFEDERFIEFKAESLNKLLEAYFELFPDLKGTKYFFFGEVQNIKGWEKFLNRIYETENYKIFVTGSNASLLSEEISTSLTGRSISVELFPFSFKEYLRYLKHDVTTAELNKTKTRSIIKKHFNDFLSNGGFPETLSDEKNINILGELYKNIIFRDVIVRYSIKNSRQFREFAQLASSNIASLHSLSSIKRAIPDIKSVNSIKKYLGFMENCFVFFTVPKFSPSIKEQLRNPFKLYMIDNGMYNAVRFSVSDSINKLYENMVYLYLRREYQPSSLFYYNNGFEVDFLIKDKNKIELIQVCSEVSGNNTIEREERALKKAMSELGVRKSYILNDDVEIEKKTAEGKIIYIPLWKWSLE